MILNIKNENVLYRLTDQPYHNSRFSIYAFCPALKNLRFSVSDIVYVYDI